MDSFGDAKIIRSFTFSPSKYAQVKAETQDPLVLLRNLALQMDWHEIEVIDSRFDDSNFQVVVELHQKGMAHTVAPGTWEIRSRAKPGAMELVTCLDDRAVFHAAEQSEWGPLSATITVEFPEGSRDVSYLEQDSAIRFSFESSATPSVTKASPWTLEATPRLMSSLAKVYGNEDFGLFWTARSVFTNTHAEPIKRFQVRYQLEGLSGWSPWKRTPIVYPGQTVVEAFFPVLDIDAMSKMDGSRSANLMAEYRYVDADGQTVEETDSRRIDVLARNEVVFSRRVSHDSINWHEANEYLPILVASFCNSNDPVIQQLAGRISGMAHGAASSLKSNDAIHYLQAIWKFMDDNKMAYQTSPTLEVDGRFGQHVKYARDVLSNRAGTCIDLAIFWASTAKAVGLKSYVVLMPGHAFPMIELPNGYRIPIEATKLGQGLSLDDAVAAGQENLEKAVQGPHFIVDVNQMENAGVRSLDLERISDDFFDKLGYEFHSLPIEAE
ncbi:MAG: transglutaminase family protein [Pirellulaceae bacterium]